MFWVNLFHKRLFKKLVMNFFLLRERKNARVYIKLEKENPTHAIFLYFKWISTYCVVKFFQSGNCKKFVHAYSIFNKKFHKGNSVHYKSVQHSLLQGSNLKKWGKPYVLHLNCIWGYEIWREERHTQKCCCMSFQISRN